MKSLLLDFLPPVALKAARRARARWRRTPVLHEWEVLPGGFEAARRDPKIKGWNEESVVRANAKSALEFRARLESKTPLGLQNVGDSTDFGALVTHATAMNFGVALGRALGAQTRPSLLDWGGALGNYFYLTRALRPDLELQYTLKEMPVFETEARRNVPEAHFLSDARALEGKYDFVLVSCALHYEENWQELLSRFFACALKGVYVARLPVVLQGEPFVFVQRPYVHGYQTEYASWCLSRQELLQIAERANWQLEREFLSGEAPQIQGASGRYEYRSFLFVPNSKN